MSKRADERQAIVRDTVDLLERLAEYYETPEECVKWFRSPQPLLEGALPIDLIAEGKAIELHRVWDNLDAGAHI